MRDINYSKLALEKIHIHATQNALSKFYPRESH